jgi:hypothetical protein
LQFDATVFGEMLNVTLLLFNLFALLVALGQRASAEDSGMQWLASVDWAGLAEDFWLVTHSDEVFSRTVIAAWIVLSILWALGTSFDAWSRRRRMLAAPALPDGKDRPTEPKILATGSTKEGQGLTAADQGAGAQANQPTPSTQAVQPSLAPEASPSVRPVGLAAAALSDPALGPLLSDLEKQVSSLPPGAQQEIDQLRRALEALVTKP